MKVPNQNSLKSSASYTCPFCNRPTTITQEDVDSAEVQCSRITNKKTIHALTQFIICPNDKCQKIALRVNLLEFHPGGMEGDSHFELIDEWQLIPPSSAKKFPDYIPRAILENYEEAYLICDLSPTASATLSRRCLQGMIRDFWEISRRTLFDEITEIKDKVEPAIWEAIEAVRTVGNIGAHMENDINVIINVEPQEAQQLLGLIEILLQDWYVAKEEKKQHLGKVKSLAVEKEKPGRKFKSD